MKSLQRFCQKIQQNLRIHVRTFREDPSVKIRRPHQTELTYYAPAFRETIAAMARQTLDPKMILGRFGPRFQLSTLQMQKRCLRIKIFG